MRDLGRLEELRLSMALALLGEPRLVAVDDVDLKLSATERAAAWELLRAVADAGTTVLAVCSEPPPEGAVVVRTGAARPDGSGPSGDAPENAENAENADKDAEDDKEGAEDALAEASRA